MDIIQDIKDCGFAEGSKYIETNQYDLAIRNLRLHMNDRAYTRKAYKLLAELGDMKRFTEDERTLIYSTRDKNGLLSLDTCTREALIKTYHIFAPFFAKRYSNMKGKRRIIDFNQGVDARLFNEENVKQLARIAIRPLRIAFDDMKTFEAYDRAIRLSAAAGLKEFSNYLLYNFKDQPIDLYRRLRINVELCEELGINIYSFPMKYHPIRKETNAEEDFSHNRDYIGVHWNRKYIRAVQAILNSTKGKVGKGLSFFYEAFGKDEREYFELLEMPETFILYRFFFKWLDEHYDMGTNHWRDSWNHCMAVLDESSKETLLDVIHNNVFSSAELSRVTSPDALKLLSFYTNYRKDIITPGTDLYRLKEMYDKNPTKQLRRKKQQP
jgi:hypothetical protein